MSDPLASQFEAIDLPAVELFIREHRQEDLHLDFKVLQQDGRFSRDDRKNVAKALSGFANSDGGLVVWGVDCRPDADGVDAANGARPISNPDRALSELQTLTSQAVNPVADGIQHKVIRGTDGSGFLVTLVPRSESTPHMAKLGEHRYYKRAGDSFVRM